MAPARDFSYLDLFDRETLDDQKRKTADALVEFTTGDFAANQDDIATYTQLMKEINQRLQKLPETEVKVSTQVLPLNNYNQFSIDCASFRSLIDKVTKFGPGREIAEFISDIDNIFARISVDARNDAKVQHNFVTCVMGQMASNYQQDVRVYEDSLDGDTVWTWKSFREYLEKTYETNKSQFQVLQALEKLEKSPGESNVDASGKIEQRLARIETLLRAHVIRKYGNGTELTARHVLSMVGGMVLLRMNEKDTDLMNYLTRDLDDCFCARDIAKLADKYIERRHTSDQVLSNPMANFARDSKRPCFSERDNGRCLRRNCNFQHKKSRGGNNSSTRGRGGRGASRGSYRGRGRPQSRQGSSGDSRGDQRRANFANQGDQVEADDEAEPFEMPVPAQNSEDFLQGSV